mmetsp:Transcript_7662/g.19089  ORF Transcript_7662/g.19089 Transcript_7662/m.19089 type:complete len:264 (+) Transcript_7662:1860-2651(+)
MDYQKRQRVSREFVQLWKVLLWIGCHQSPGARTRFQIRSQGRGGLGISGAENRLFVCGVPGRQRQVRHVDDTSRSDAPGIADDSRGSGTRRVFDWLRVPDGLWHWIHRRHACFGRHRTNVVSRAPPAMVGQRDPAVSERDDPQQHEPSTDGSQVVAKRSRLLVARGEHQAHKRRSGERCFDHRHDVWNVVGFGRPDQGQPGANENSQPDIPHDGSLGSHSGPPHDQGQGNAVVDSPVVHGSIPPPRTFPFLAKFPPKPSGRRF